MSMKLRGSSDLVKVLDKETRKARGLVTPNQLAVSALSGDNLTGIMGAWSEVVKEYKTNCPSNPLPSGSIVLGDTTYYRYQLREGGNWMADPEDDTYNIDGVGMNWINLEQEIVTTLIRKYFENLGDC